MAERFPPFTKTALAESEVPETDQDIGVWRSQVRREAQFQTNQIIEAQIEKSKNTPKGSLDPNFLYADNLTLREILALRVQWKNTPIKKRQA